MLLLLLFPLLWGILSSAETICVPASFSGHMPALSSCDAALVKLEDLIVRCGNEKVIVGPTASGAHYIRLPLYYVDDAPSPGTSRCVVQVTWQPRPRIRPPVASFDIFYPSVIQRTAFRIRDQCVQGNRFHGPQLGKEWIEPHQWVLVQFGSASVINETTGNFSDAASGNFSVMWADGTNQTVTDLMFGQTEGSGILSPSVFQNGAGLNVENDSELKITTS